MSQDWTEHVHSSGKKTKLEMQQVYSKEKNL